jgi:hypothetical protein
MNLLHKPEMRGNWKSEINKRIWCGKKGELL